MRRRTELHSVRDYSVKPVDFEVNVSLDEYYHNLWEWQEKTNRKGPRERGKARST